MMATSGSAGSASCRLFEPERDYVSMGETDELESTSTTIRIGCGARACPAAIAGAHGSAAAAASRKEPRPPAPKMLVRVIQDLRGSPQDLPPDVVSVGVTRA